jgi:ribosomal protein S2
MVTIRQFKERENTIATFIQDAQLAGSMLNTSDIENLVDRLHRYETTLHRIAEIWCSVELTEKQAARLEEKESRIEKKVQGIAELLRFKVHTQGDPRGGTIRFTLPSGRSNNWDQETWGIYW